MSKFFRSLFIGMLLCSMGVLAQQLPDPHFEDWSGASFSDNVQPKYWHGSNVEQVGLKFNFTYREAGRSGADFSIYLSPIAGRITSAYVGEGWNKKYTREGALGEYQYAIDHATTPAEKADAQAAYNDAAASYDNNLPFDGYAFYQESHLDLRSTLQEKYGTIGYDKTDGHKL